MPPMTVVPKTRLETAPEPVAIARGTVAKNEGEGSH